MKQIVCPVHGVLVAIWIREKMGHTTFSSERGFRCKLKKNMVDVSRCALSRLLAFEFSSSIASNMSCHLGILHGKPEGTKQASFKEAFAVLKKAAKVDFARTDSNSRLVAVKVACLAIEIVFGMYDLAAKT